MADKSAPKGRTAKDTTKVLITRADLVHLYAWSRGVGADDTRADLLRIWIRDFNLNQVSNGSFEGEIPATIANIAIGVCEYEIDNGSDLTMVYPARDLIRRLRGIPG